MVLEMLGNAERAGLRKLLGSDGPLEGVPVAKDMSTADPAPAKGAPPPPRPRPSPTSNGAQRVSGAWQQKEGEGRGGALAVGEEERV